MNGLIGQISGGLQQLEVANRIKNVFIAALTPQQQLAISAKIMGDLNLLPSMLVSWGSTEAGKQAIQQLANQFIGPNGDSSRSAAAGSTPAAGSNGT